MVNDRMQQRMAFASQQTNRDIQNAMSQYGEYTKQNPQQPAVNMSQYMSKPVTQMQAAPTGGVNTSYSQAWNSAQPQIDSSRTYASVDPLRGIPRRSVDTYKTTAAKSYGGGGEGNLAYMPVDKRPAPFQAQYADFDGTISDAPVTNKRDALIERINAAASPYFANSGIRDTTMGPQQFDMPSLMRQAGDMASQGYVNPLLQGLFANSR